MKYSKLDNNYALRWAKRIRAINLLGGKCKECGNENIFQLEFHHIDPANKNANISDLFTGNRGNSKRWSVIKKEVEKCCLYCRNCHAMHHDGGFNIIKDKLLRLKGTKHCQKCGYSKCLSALDFHHRDRNMKEFQISKAYAGSVNHIRVAMGRLLLEMDKCDIVCKNCHMLEHTDMDRFDSLSEYIYKKVETHKELKPRLDEKIVWKFYKKGYNPTEIAIKLDRSRSTINAILNRLKRS